MNLKSTTANGFTFQIVNSFMKSWGVPGWYLICGYMIIWLVVENSLQDFFKLHKNKACNILPVLL